jgi:hypothetical protein
MIYSMFKKLKHFFVHNKATRNLIFVILFVELIFVFPKALNLFDYNSSGYYGAVLPAILNILTNQSRQQANLQNLKESALLDKAAQLKANDMVLKGYFAHVAPDGKTPWYWFTQVGYQYDYAGENLAINFTDSKDVTNAWMNSPTHKANILKSTYTEIGTGTATGMYNGQEAIFVVQLYATPKLLK